jgi:hypothetical protein
MRRLPAGLEERPVVHHAVHPVRIDKHAGLDAIRVDDIILRRSGEFMQPEHRFVPGEAVLAFGVAHIDDFFA